MTDNLPASGAENVLVMLMNLVNASANSEELPCPSDGEFVAANMRCSGREWRLILWIKRDAAVETFVIHESGVKLIIPDV